MLRCYFSAIVIALIFVSCGEKKVDETSGSNTPANSTILAKVNGETLTLEDMMQQFPVEYRDQVRGKDLQDAVETWINTQLLSTEGIRKGLDKDPGVLAVMRFRKADAVARRLIDNDITSGVTVSPTEVDSVYNILKADYIKASHILVKTNDEADAIYNRLKKGDDFGKLAADYSLDKQSAANGGEMGYFTLSQISQFDMNFAQALGQLKIGEFSRPVQTEYGYHLIKLTGRLADEKGPAPMEVTAKLSQELLSEKQNNAYNVLLDSLKKNAKIERFSPPGLDLPEVPNQG